MNTINSVDNTSFKSRYFNMKQMEALPPRISEAIYKNDAFDTFLNAGKPKTLLERFLNLFKSNEIINVDFYKEPIVCSDPYAEKGFLSFILTKNNKVKRVYTASFSQDGVMRNAGSIPKPGEHPIFREPYLTVVDKIVEHIKNIEDFDKLLR